MTANKTQQQYLHIENESQSCRKKEIPPLTFDLDIKKCQLEARHLIVETNIRFDHQQ